MVQVPSLGEARVHVLEAGEVTSYGDEVQPLLVLHVVRRDGAVRAFDDEGDLPVTARPRDGVPQRQGVAALGDHQSTGHGSGVLTATLGMVPVDFLCGVAFFSGMTTARVPGGLGRLADRTDQGPHAVREHEGHRHPEEEARDPGRCVHASW